MPDLGGLMSICDSQGLLRIHFAGRGLFSRDRVRDEVGAGWKVHSGKFYAMSSSSLVCVMVM